MGCRGVSGAAGLGCLPRLLQMAAARTSAARVWCVWAGFRLRPDAAPFAEVGGVR